MAAMIDHKTWEENKLKKIQAIEDELLNQWQDPYQYKLIMADFKYQTEHLLKSTSPMQIPAPIKHTGKSIYRGGQLVGFFLEPIVNLK